MKKIIFLDHDGVICLSSEWGSRFKNGTVFDRLNSKAVNVLNEILDATGAEIVISSDWKLHATLDELQSLYIEEGIKKLPIAVTPNYHVTRMGEFGDLKNNRIHEIDTWLQNHDDIITWVAIDDLEMFDLGEEHFVYCPRSNEGIKQSGLKEKIIKLLNKEDETNK